MQILKQKKKLLKFFGGIENDTRKNMGTHKRRKKTKKGIPRPHSRLRGLGRKTQRKLPGGLLGMNNKVKEEYKYWLKKLDQTDQHNEKKEIIQKLISLEQTTNQAYGIKTGGTHT